MTQKVIELTDKQRLAIHLIILGSSDTEVAKELGITRETVNRWKNNDETFIIHLNSERLKIWESSSNYLLSLLPNAIDILSDEMKGENKFKAAIEILKAAGFYGSVGPPKGPTSLYEISSEGFYHQMKRMTNV